MATRKPATKKTTKKPVSMLAWRTNWPGLVLVVVCGAFALILVAAAVLYAVKDQLKPTSVVVDMSIAEVAPEQTVDNTTIEYRDADYVAELRTFVHNEADKMSGDDNCDAPWYKVTHVTRDGQQLKLAYSCGTTTGVTAFATHQNGTWQLVLPQFDLFDTPRCEDTNMHSISTEIAPICWNGPEDRSDITYVVR